MADSFGRDFKTFFLRGLTAVLPTLLTIAIIFYVFGFLDKHLGRYVNTFLQWAVIQFQGLFSHQPWSVKGPDVLWTRLNGIWEQYHLWWLGFLLSLVLIYIIGRFVASFLGRNVWRLVETGLSKTPVFKQVYPYVKQVTDFMLSEKKLEFSRVVALEYPRHGIWSIGLVTGPGMQTVRNAAGEDLLTVFIPSSPTPFTGYVLTVKKDEVIDLPISIDEAIRFVVSGGVIMPAGQQLSQAEIDQARQGLLPSARKKKEVPA